MYICILLYQNRVTYEHTLMKIIMWVMAGERMISKEREHVQGSIQVR